MPPWLVELLQQHNSKGFADTLSALVAPSNFIKLPPYREGDGQRAGKVVPDNQGNPQIGLTDYLLQNFGRQNITRAGYKPLDKKQKLGDYVLAHETGHVAASGIPNFQLQEQLEKTDKNIRTEEWADDFQNSVQFLRNPQADTTKLSGRQALITNILLQQPIYAAHPINQRRMLEQFLMGQTLKR